MSLRRLAVFCLAVALVVGCAPAAPPRAAAQVPSRPVQPYAAERLLVDVSSCWLGGMWGEPPAQRERTAVWRCSRAVRTVRGWDDHDLYEGLRRFDPRATAVVRREIGTLAILDLAEAPDAVVLTELYDALVDAEHETMGVRRAAVGLGQAEAPETLSAEEVALLPRLRARWGFDELLHMDAGRLQGDARSLVLLVMLSRMRAAEQLPRYLEPYALARALHELLGIPEPELPQDASTPLPKGGWVWYLSNAAATLGHPVMDASAPEVARHDEAIAGIVAGIADRLRANLPSMVEGAPLEEATRLTIRALDSSGR